MHKMPKRACLMLSIALGVLAPAAAQATVVGFDDLGPCCSPIPNGYAGLDWNNFYSIQDNELPGSGYDNGTVSPHNTAFNWFANPASISSGTPFTFNSAYLTAAWNNGLSIKVDGLLGSSLLYTNTVVVDTTGPTLFNFNYSGVDTVLFTSFGGTNADLGGSGAHFAMDDMTIDAAAIPEPTVLTLYGIGLVGLRFAARRRQR
ncbi:MAG TPA: PEP-CTERM sorting domain-containing protein [Vicinamibacteria bacterium]|nr:PEP-CTERM sorting domain-containing protein [Vicinamibacteria bacterium]